MGALRRWSRPARHGLAVLALRGLVGGLRILPRAWARALGAGLGRALGALARRDTATMRRQLTRLPAAPPPGACWASLGRRFVDFARADVACVALPPEAEATLRAALAQGRGLLVCTAHVGHWELLAARLARLGHPVHAVGARDRASPLHRWLKAHRQRLGVTVHGPGGARIVRRHLAAGGAVGIFIDQHTGERGRPVPFLGVPVPTPATAERLVAATGAVPVFAAAPRHGDGYRVVVHPLPVEGLLEAATAHVEALVRADPPEWVWLHRRG